MPANPGYVADTGVQAGRISPVMPAPQPLGLDRAAAQLDAAGDQHLALMRQRQNRIDQLELLTATTGAKGELAELDRALTDDPDWRAAPGRYAEAAKAIKEKYGLQVAERIGTQRPEDAKFFRARFDALLDDDILGGQGRVLASSRKRERDEAVAGLDTLTAQTAQAIAAASDPLRKGGLLMQARQAIAIMRDTDQIDAVEAGKRERGLLADIAENEAQALISRDPAKAYEALSDPKSFPDLPGDRRERWARQALAMAEARQRQRLADEDRAEARAGRDLAKRGDEAAKALSDLDAAGGLTLEAVQARRSDLAPAEYRLFLKRLDPKAAEVRTDLRTYTGLNARLDREDIAPDIVAAQEQGRLSLDDAKSLAERNRNALKDDRPASPYRQGRDLVRQTLDPGQLLSGPAADAARKGMADALDDFDSWIGANPNAPAAEVKAEARDTVRRYQIVAFDQMAIATGLPRGYRGTRADMTPEKLDDAERQVVAEMDAGRLPRELAAREIQRIEQWRVILSRKPAQGSSGPAEKK